MRIEGRNYINNAPFIFILFSFSFWGQKTSHVLVTVRLVCPWSPLLSRLSWPRPVTAALPPPSTRSLHSEWVAPLTTPSAQSPPRHPLWTPPASRRDTLLLFHTPMRRKSGGSRRCLESRDLVMTLLTSHDNKLLGGENDFLPSMYNDCFFVFFWNETIRFIILKKKFQLFNSLD